ncbi:MAG: VWA domain-containing protein [Thermomicrobiales bacterium]|nr:VWA domain-containing protein [Thermomicrobiales bacterium]
MNDIAFARPDALWLLLLIPVLLGVAWRKLPSGDRRALGLALLRAVGLVAMILALAEPLLARPASGASVVFVVDRSASVPAAASDEISRWVNQALEGAPAGSEAAVVTFGGNPDVAARPATVSDVAESWQTGTGGIDTTATNLESALAVANALPVQGSRRIVVLSDGVENDGAALSQVGQSAPIDTVYAPGIATGDLRLEALTGPTALWNGDTAVLIATIASPGAANVTIRVEIDGAVEAEQSLAIEAGVSNHAIALGALEPGFHSVVVTVIPADGASNPVLENDRLPFGLVIRDAPAVLIITDEQADSGRLGEALTASGALVSTVRPDRVPTRLADLAPFDAIVLNNVSAAALSVDQVAAIEQAARSLGKGVLVLGGASSYGPGGYASTGLERMLPVSVKVTDGAQRPRVALLLIIDRSGSMTYNPVGGPTKLDLARDAAKLALTALADGDQIGVLAFNDRQQWIVPMTAVEGQASRDTINAAIDGLSGDSGTELYPAMQVGIDAIRAVDVDVRHVIVLSDGKSRSGTRESYFNLLDTASRDRVSVSTLALGDDADLELLQFIAQNGAGRFHFTNKPEDIPSVTLAEARAAGSQSVVRGGFQPIQLEPSPIMNRFDPTTLPLLDGYDYAETKAAATSVLVTARGDPLLATWQYGLGRVVAWTADDGADFALAWPEWNDYGAFFGSMLRWALPDPEARPVDVSVERSGGSVRFQLEPGVTRGEPVDLAGASLDVALPDGSTMQGVLTQTAPDTWEATLPIGETFEAFEATVAWTAGSTRVAQSYAVMLPPSPELRPASDGASLLMALSARSGGEVRSLDSASGVFDAPSGGDSGLTRFVPIWRGLLGLGMALLVLEWSLRLRFWSRIAFLVRGRT